MNLRRKTIFCVILLAVLYLCTAAPALAAHTHSWTVLSVTKNDEKTHHVYKKCVGCGERTTTDEPHNIIVESDNKTFTWKCSQCGYISPAKSIDNNCWMGAIPQQVPISQINLPGTYGSGTRYSYAQHQITVDYTIPEQLSQGVRLLNVGIDTIDVGTWNNWPNYNITFQRVNMSTGKKSGLHWQELWLGDVFHQIDDFLTQNPTETVVVILNLERYSDKDKGNRRIAEPNGIMDNLHYNNPNRNDHGFSKFVSYRSGDPVPTLGESRGKCIVLYLLDNSMTNFYIEPDSHCKEDDDQEPSAETKFEMQYTFSSAFRSQYALPQDYSGKTTYKFCNENFRTLKNLGTPQVKLLDCGGDLPYVNHPNVDGLFEHGAFRRSWNTNYIYNDPLSTANFEKGKRVGWLLMFKPAPKTIQNIYLSNLFGQEKPPIEPATQEPVDYGFRANNWMAYMPNNAQISQLNLPGTHDSGTAFMAAGMPTSKGQCQEKTIREQLDAGIRAFDIRVGSRSKGGPYSNYPWNMEICHGALGNVGYTGPDKKTVLTLGRVFQQVKEFLDANKSETVVLMIAEEQDKDAAIKRIERLRDSQWHGGKQSIDGLPPLDFVEFYKMGEKVPTLKDCRGKCIVFWDDSFPDETGKNYNSFSSYENEYDVGSDTKAERIMLAMDNFYLHYVQDYAHSNDLFKDNGYRSGRNPGNPYIRWVGYNSNACSVQNPAGPGPKSIFDDMKSYLETIRPRRGKRVGWVAMDFPTDTMIRAIINSNRIFSMSYHVELDLPEQFAYDLTHFSRVQLVRWTDDDPMPVVVDEMDGDAWELENNGTLMTLDFRLYHEDEFDTQYYYDIVFPDANEFTLGRAHCASPLDDLADAPAINLASAFSVVRYNGRVDLPSTGDNAPSPALLMLAALLSAAGCAALVSKKRSAR